jgi:hypothetical protein
MAHLPDQPDIVTIVKLPLPEDQALYLAVLSARSGATIAQLIQQAIAEYLATQDLGSLDAAAREYNELTWGPRQPD